MVARKLREKEVQEAQLTASGDTPGVNRSRDRNAAPQWTPGPAQQVGAAVPSKPVLALTEHGRMNLVMHLGFHTRESYVGLRHTRRLRNTDTPTG